MTGVANKGAAARALAKLAIVAAFHPDKRTRDEMQSFIGLVTRQVAEDGGPPCGLHPEDIAKAAAHAAEALNDGFVWTQCHSSTWYSTVCEALHRMDASHFGTEASPKTFTLPEPPKPTGMWRIED